MTVFSVGKVVYDVNDVASYIIPYLTSSFNKVACITSLYKYFLMFRFRSVLINLTQIRKRAGNW